ncbi:E3 ubiquitin-protein ligase NRDP1 [Megalopta genalis]|uniref:E3 ubiquitin-protein ligase NRDP1 n=1 Tax=Megalopta genalis TaxID=115081 RepID=UPI0014436154|nr:E3 ubiquitin-protein ligase NRDP1-like [Megalopta genalis]XP_033342864.1 E3 ubiquitin-protein ligase NRDP1-like [Megalopta genalis]
MGFSVNRFQGEVDQELICVICSGVLEDPIQIPECEHTFCRTCIKEWMKRQATCPIDHTPITSEQLRAAPRILRNMLTRLCISCDNIMYGCQAIVKLDSLVSHLEQCEYNLERPMLCNQGCNLVIPKNEFKDHNCVRELRNIINSREQKFVDIKHEMGEQQLQIVKNEQELQHIKNLLKIKLEDYIRKASYLRNNCGGQQLQIVENKQDLQRIKDLYRIELEDFLHKSYE